MPKPLLIIQHADHEAPGILGEILQREGVPTETHDVHRGDPVPTPEHYCALLVMGGPQSANDDTEPMRAERALVRSAIERGFPFFGVCLGLQVGVKAMGGGVVKNAVREIAALDGEGTPFVVDLTPEGKSDPLLRGVDDSFPMFHLHGETVEIGADMQLLGTGKWCRNQIVRIADRAYGMQGHLELTPSLLKQWCERDAWLRERPPEDVLVEWQAHANDYRRNCERIFGNFLRLAEVGSS